MERLFPIVATAVNVQSVLTAALYNGLSLLVIVAPVALLLKLLF